MDFFRYASNSAIRKSSSVLGSQMVQSEAIRKRIFGVSPYIFTLPIPVGVTAGGDPYFAPPVTLPPFPSGYTPEGIPFYGRASIVQPHVLGITSSGVRYYSNDGKLLTADTPSRYLTAGYSYSGHAFYLPRGLAFPAPTGFTSDGIAFYDIPSMLLYPGNLLLPQSFAMLDQDLMSEDDKFNAMLAKGLNSEELAGFLSCMKSQLTQQFAYLQSSLRKMDRKSNSNLFIEGSLKDLARRASLHDFFEPMDVAPLLQSVDQFAHTKSCSLRLCLEPSLVAFQSMTLSSTKTAVLRFRVSRGDRDSRDFFISAQPSNLFSVNLSRIVVQGEGVQNVEVTFDPNAMTSQQTEGLLTLIDDSGKCHTSCSLVGLRQSFFKALPGKLEGGWILPGRSKTLYVKITNTSGIQVSLTLCLESERRSLGSQEALKGAEACSILKSNVKLQPQESVQVPILLSRDVPGKYLDTVEVVGPGGDVSRIPVEFKCGNPVVIHPESEEDSKVPLQALSRERTHFLNRFSLAQKDMIDYRTSVTARDTPIFKSIIAATTDFTGAPFSCTVDFGICARSKTKFSRSVTFLNVTDATMTIALKSQSPFVSAPYVLTIAARAAQTVSVELCVNPDDAVCKGNINTYIDVICSEFEGCKIQVFAFVGEPLYFPIWEYSFFKACRLYQKDSITAFLVNDSQYPFDVSVSRSHNESNRLSSILCSLDRRWRIEAFSIIPVHFEYRADDLGPYMQVFDLQVHSPFKAVLKPTVNSTSLKLIGICLEPILSSERGQDSKGIDFIRKWLSQPSRIFEEYPTASERKRLFDLPINKSTQKEIVLEDSGPIRYEMASLYSDSGSGATGYNSFRSLSQKLQISNLSDKLHSSVIFSTPFFTPNARNKTLQPNESQTVEVLFSPPTDFPPFLRVHGGLFSFSDGNGSCDSCQLLNNLQTNVLVSPLQNGDGINVLDFGNIEVATGLSVSCEKTFTIFNMMDCTIIWTTKISQAKYNNFSFSSIEGEILANESQTVTVTFQTDSHGDFETKIDVLVKNSLQTKGAPVKVAFIHVRGVAYAFSMSGIPDSMDLGSSLVSQERSNQFEMLNNGSCSVSLRLFTSAPFSVFPAEKILGVKASVVVTVSFKPSESRNVTSTLQIFAGNKQFSVSLCGIGGTVELMAHEKSIDFGRQQEDTICWASLFLSNRGSLPLSLLNITADNPELLKLQFLGVTNTSSQDQQNTTFIEKDYWAILKRKKNFAKVAMGNKPFQQIHLKKSTTIRGESIPIRRLSQDPSPIISRIIPVLHPFQAYHFRLGYRGTYGRLSGTSIFFDYGSLVTEVKNVESKKNTFERIPVTVRGTAYKTLDFFPLSYNFGLVAIAGDGEKVNPADTSMGIFDAGSTIKTCALEVSNMSIESENLFLDFIHPDFFVPNRDWHIQPGEKVLIHIEFRPSKAQVQCQGYAKFRFNRGHKFVYLSGTGACAHLLAPDEMDWGNMKIGSNMSKMLSLKNLGYMPSHFEMEIVQQSSDFKFVDSDPFEMVGCIEPGSSIEFKINCNCQSKDSRSAKIHIRWLKTPRGKWIQYEIPLKVKIGVPEFKLRNLEIDYGTVYIDNEKELPLTFSNTGNAVCGWTAEYANHYLFMDKVSGHLQPGQSTTIRVRFAPSTYDPLNVPVRFHTDAGSRTVTCYAIVGVPYLKIPLEHLNTKFGIVAVGKSQSQPVLLKNTGTKAIDFEVINVQQIENGNVMSSTEFDIFQFEPMSGTISATEMMILNLKAKPRQYLSTYELRYEVETKDGEIYKGGATAVGGQAIVKVKHTSVEAPGGSIAMTAEEEIRDIDSRRTIMSSHMEHLRELIAGNLIFFCHIGSTSVISHN